MKIVGKSMIAVAFVLCVGTLFSFTGQVLLKQLSEPGVRAESDERHEVRVESDKRHVVRLAADERHVYLEPQQEMEMVEVTGGCITFLTEVRFSVPLPFGNTVEIALPPGSRWPIPAGKYKLDNPTNAPIEYVLKKGSTCRDISPK